MPRKPGGAQLHLVVPLVIRQLITEAATEDHRSVNGEVIALLELGLAYRRRRARFHQATESAADPPQN